MLQPRWRPSPPVRAVISARKRLPVFICGARSADSSRERYPIISPVDLRRTSIALRSCREGRCIEERLAARHLPRISWRRSRRRSRRQPRPLWRNRLAALAAFFRLTGWFADLARLRFPLFDLALREMSRNGNATSDRATMIGEKISFISLAKSFSSYAKEAEVPGSSAHRLSIPGLERALQVHFAVMS